MSLSPLVDETTFSDLARVCDALFTDASAEEARLANVFLHVVSGHPIHLAQYAAALGGVDPGNLRGTLGAATRHARSVSRAIVGATSVPSEPCDVVFVGGLVDAKHLSRQTDFYFGNLQAALAERGVRSLLLLRNQTGERTAVLAPLARREGAAARFLLPDAHTPAAEAGFIARAVTSAARLGRESRAKSGFDKTLTRHAAAAAASASTTANLRLEAQLAAICRSVRPRVVMAMYEGHAWERCVWHGARQADRGIVCAGYQHTILRRHSHAIRRKVGFGADPDVVFCLGDVTARALAGEPGLEGTEFVVLGTHRRETRERPTTAPSRQRTCLVLPEGILSEATRLFSFAADAARRDPTMRFIFRSHPILPFARVSREASSLCGLPANVELSAGAALDGDLDRCGWLVYRGSSTALYGVLSGLRPLYLRNEGELSLDPLYAVRGWPERASSFDDFAAAVAEDARQSDAERLDLWTSARDYCERYVLPEQASAIDHLAALARGTVGVERPHYI